MSKEKYRARVHMILLYPDNESHVEALARIAKSYDYAGIKHDKDTWTEEDEKKNPEHKQGELKKEHYHIVLRTPNATWNTALCKELGIEEKFCEQAKNVDNALQYLIHYNDTDKTTYPIDEVFGSMKVKLTESINKVEKSEGEKVVELIQFIQNHDGRLRITEFAEYCAKNGYWAEFRRAGAIFNQIIAEHNYQFEKAMVEANHTSFIDKNEAIYARLEREAKQNENEEVEETFEQIEIE